MKQYCLRLPSSVYADAFDVAAVFGLSLNKLLLTAVCEYVESQLKQEATRAAVAKAREARQAGLAHGYVAETDRIAG
ncbi:MAG: hypothetical protein WEF50_12855 [Myxococcota bacterium]